MSQYRYGKALGKEFISKPEYEEPLFPEFTVDNNLLNKTIAEHMYRSG